MIYLSLVSCCKGTIKRGQSKRKTCFSFLCRAQVPSTKVRLTEDKAKGKLVFLFFVERKYLRQQIKGKQKLGVLCKQSDKKS